MMTHAPEPSTAREKFAIGQKVKLSPDGIARNIRPRCNRLGTVVGYHRKYEYLVLVRIGQNAQAEAFHLSFWDPV